MVQGEFFMGDNATLADMHLFDIVENESKVSFPEFDFSKYPKLESVIEAVKTNANVTGYLTKA
uniref:GST C-terminal domain-containing protein n=1 Tax=Globisporangium ultimum (strain ATCC 200006 / CBS 805.95 / DAOM BR144) TaxID=431595 RepID=K3WK04_GLOUD